MISIVYDDGDIVEIEFYDYWNIKNDYMYIYHGNAVRIIPLFKVYEIEDDGVV